MRIVILLFVAIGIVISAMYDTEYLLSVLWLVASPVAVVYVFWEIGKDFCGIHAFGRNKVAFYHWMGFRPTVLTIPFKVNENGDLQYLMVQQTSDLRKRKQQNADAENSIFRFPKQAVVHSVISETKETMIDFLGIPRSSFRIKNDFPICCIKSKYSQQKPSLEGMYLFPPRGLGFIGMLVEIDKEINNYSLGMHLYNMQFFSRDEVEQHLKKVVDWEKKEDRAQFTQKVIAGIDKHESITKEKYGKWFEQQNE
ncbi:hypothetical protein [Candidatus Uabimicrobium sp. HlEnr_7]|uniref:hypothetical protein n=1 Tax=Candidatus Uabimicrobium helgolandensis TaxID=3095367 RepID=UPI003557F2D3